MITFTVSSGVGSSDLTTFAGDTLNVLPGGSTIGMVISSGGHQTISSTSR